MGSPPLVRALGKGGWDCRPRREHHRRAGGPGGPAPERAPLPGHRGVHRLRRLGVRAGRAQHLRQRILPEARGHDAGGMRQFRLGRRAAPRRHRAHHNRLEGVRADRGQVGRRAPVQGGGRPVARHPGPGRPSAGRRRRGAVLGGHQPRHLEPQEDREIPQGSALPAQFPHGKHPAGRGREGRGLRDHPLGGGGPRDVRLARRGGGGPAHRRPRPGPRGTCRESGRHPGRDDRRNHPAQRERQQQLPKGPLGHRLRVVQLGPLR